MTYDESQVLAFIDDATRAYVEAHATVDPHAGVHIARMQYDAWTLGYQGSRDKHLTALRQSLGLTPAPAPPVSVVSFDVPKGTDFTSHPGVLQFIGRAKTLAYGAVTAVDYDYNLSHQQELLDRGTELGMLPPERYWWERMIGRGCGAADVARHGPYAGLVECQESLSEGS